MSMEIYALSNVRLASMDEWQLAVRAEGFDLRLSADMSFQVLSGHLPAWWREKQAGFECDHWNARELMDEYPDVDFRRRWTYALAFRWGADLYACQAANMAATAYARATEGVVFEPEAGIVLAPQEAAARVRDMERTLPAIEAALGNIAQRFRPK